jgi:hypothetical protein
MRVGLYNSDTMLELYVYDEDSGRLKLLKNDHQYSCIADKTTIFLHHRTTPPGIWNFSRYFLYTYTTTLCNFIIRMTAMGVIYSWVLNEVNSLSWILQVSCYTVLAGLAGVLIWWLYLRERNCIISNSKPSILHTDRKL